MSKSLASASSMGRPPSLGSFQRLTRSTSTEPRSRAMISRAFATCLPRAQATSAERNTRMCPMIRLSWLGRSPRRALGPRDPPSSSLVACSSASTMWSKRESAPRQSPHFSHACMAEAKLNESGATWYRGISSNKSARARLPSPPYFSAFLASEFRIALKVKMSGDIPRLRIIFKTWSTFPRSPAFVTTLSRALYEMRSSFNPRASM
mmetsp:Transcript_30708/g.68880  ORF Transcript_30708/g.68880 Transcript_30708/m.68880 type:complete len:207 (+) Transcript_30708:1325-1945(+)